jgi:Inner membrane protein YgaP-like, transmembrane domain
MEVNVMVQLIDKSLQNSNALQNIGLIDRTVRIIVGAAMVSVLFFYPIGSVSLWFAGLALVGVLPLLSGILGWCPVYAMFHTKSCGTDGHNSCGTIPDQVDHMIHPH